MKSFKMEHNFDSEDMAIFYRSLLLLHSPKIDSQRKLYHLMNQSIRKHHPSRKIPYGKKNSELPCTEYSVCKTSVKSLPESLDKKNDVEIAVSQSIPRLKKEQNSVKAGMTNHRDPRPKVDTECTKSGSQKCDKSNHVTTTQPSTSSSVVNISLINGLRNFTSTHISSESNTALPKKNPRVSHYVSGDSPLLRSVQKASPKTTMKHNYCPNPVNLKKIRAVLARGDPFPTHLTKTCVNNILPNLHREKL